MSAHHHRRAKDLFWIRDDPEFRAAFEEIGSR
jgi:hypothetical protein